MINRFTEGDIVYWCHSHGHEYSVHYGMVDEQFSDAVIVDYLSPRERRLVDGIPINEFESESRYRKLPKGWDYKTELFSITYEPFSEEEKAYKFSKSEPESIKRAYDLGFLVKDKEIFHGQIEAEITKNGFRIRKTYPAWKHINHVAIRPYKLYRTYDEAAKEVSDNIAEFIRQSELSEYDWSVEQIDKTLSHYKHISDVSDNEVKQYRDCLLSMPCVENIETRVFNGEVQWKYWKNKRWNYIEL